MTVVFSDTFYWVALTNRHDPFHHQALALPGALGFPRIVTTEAVLTESLNFFTERGEYFRRKAERNVRDMLSTPSVVFALRARSRSWRFPNCTEIVPTRATA